MKVAVVSLDPWDEVERRNQHLVTGLLDAGVASSVTYVDPVRRGRGRPALHPRPGLTVLRPGVVVPRRYDDRRLVAGLVAARLRGADVLWVNDPVVGRRVAALLRRTPAVYDVTDDWRSSPSTDAARVVAAEDALARRAATVVCSAHLQELWRARYGVEATLVPNGVPALDWPSVAARPLGPGRHVGYVGTLHEERLDVPLVVALAATATVHLVGPDSLGPQSRSALTAAGVRLHGPVPAADVPGWLLGLDVLLLPHVLTPFTASLDAIKAYEYLASGRPVVATPTSGFAGLASPGVAVVAPGPFAAAVATALDGPRTFDRGPVPTWAARAEAFGAALAAAAVAVHR